MAKTKIQDIKDIKDKLQTKWSEIARQSYICYSVKELAYKVMFDIRNALDTDDYLDDCYIGYKFINGKHKVICQIDEVRMPAMITKPLYFTCDIYWNTGLFGDSVLLVGNGKLSTKVPQGYQDIEDCLEDEEEEE